jgi:hypothetical protein
MHLHPMVGRLLLDIGREFGLSHVRVPAEPPAVLARCGTRVGFGTHALYHWTRLLRRQVRAAGMTTTDHCFGTPERPLRRSSACAGYWRNCPMATRDLLPSGGCA